MDNKLVMISIAAVIGIIVLGSVLMPIMNDATATTDTFTNDGYFRMSQYDTTTDHTITWTYEKPSVLTVDNEDVTINYHAANGQVTVIANSVWLVRMYNDANGNVSGIGFLYGSSGTKLVNVSDNGTASVTLNDGSASVVFGTYTGTLSYDIVYLPDNDGDYVMSNPNNPMYINSDSNLYGFGLTRIRNSTGVVGSPGVGFAFSGNYTDGITGSVWRGGDLVVVSDCVCNATADNSYKDLLKFESITATATLTETVDDQTVTTDTDLTYNTIIIPNEVSSERSVHFTAGQNAIFAAIPVMIILAVLLGVVALVIRSRMD